MKWTIHELKKIARSQPNFEGIINLNRFLTEDVLDVAEIGDVFVKGSFQLVNQDSQYWFDITIQTVLKMTCAISLELIDVPLSFETQLVFARTEIDDSTYLIDGITIDLDPIIYSEILVEKPMRVVKSGVELEQYHSNPEFEIEKESTNPFQTLKKDYEEV